MIHEWTALAELSQGQAIQVERVRLERSGIAIEGAFRLPALAALGSEDQAFVIAFLHAHGSLKQMEAWFGISYPTVKNRLRRLCEALPLTQPMASTGSSATADSAAVLDRLAAGEIDVAAALAALNGDSSAVGSPGNHREESP